MIWGIEDKSHRIVGTTFEFQNSIKIVLLEHFLMRQITSNVLFQFHKFKIDDKQIIVLVISAADKIPTAYKKCVICGLAQAKLI